MEEWVYNNLMITFGFQMNDLFFSTTVQLGDHISICEIEDLYLMMGREFEDQEYVPAGNVLGWLHNSFSRFSR